MLVDGDEMRDWLGGQEVISLHRSSEIELRGKPSGAPGPSAIMVAEEISATDHEEAGSVEISSNRLKKKRFVP
jgi:hypothetical protein